LESFLQIISYNILSHHLTEAERYPKSSPEDLNPSIRLTRIKKKLNSEIQKNSILCLQEVPLDWAGDFHKFFISHNYYFVIGHYGKTKNGYMGIGIAVPLEIYNVDLVKIERLADSVGWKPISKINLFLRAIAKRTFSLIGKSRDSLDHPGIFAKKRMNQFVFLDLENKKSSHKFSIATYHMPMAFFLPQVMSIHIAMYINRTQELANGKPLILTGDFNLSPKSPQYNWISKGIQDTNHVAYPMNLIKNGTENFNFPMRSAYSTVMGKEPDWTNYGQNGQKKPFIDTLDYIWISNEWKVTSVIPLPHLAEIQSPLPNEQEPSDHLMIGADLEL
jgi:2',5'-phosphodiesterase